MAENQELKDSIAALRRYIEEIKDYRILVEETYQPVIAHIKNPDMDPVNKQTFTTAWIVGKYTGEVELIRHKLKNAEAYLKALLGAEDANANEEKTG
jgi:hypothetical protein